MEIGFPTNLEEFGQLLKEFDCSEPDAFLGDEFSDINAASFLFLWSMWKFMEDPKETSYTPKYIEFLQKKAEEYPKSADRRLPILKKMIELGVTPQEISQLVFLEHERYAQLMVYHLGDPTSVIPWSIGENFGVQLCMSTEDEGADPKRPLWALSDLFHSAMPNGRAE